MSSNSTAAPPPPPPPNPAHFFGATYFGAAFLFMLTGFVLSQALRYFSGCRSDRPLVKAGAVYLTMLTIFQTSLSFWTTWKQLVQGWGDWNVGFHIFWTLKLHPILTTGMALPIQILMVQRCYVAFRMNRLFIAPYVFLVCFVAISGFVDSMLVLKFDFNAVPRHADTTVVSTPTWLLSSAILDTATSATLLIHILRTRASTVSFDMNRFLNRVIRLVWETALPPSLWAILVAILHFLVSVVNQDTFIVLWSIAGMQLLGQIYALAYFINVNFRLDVKQERTLTSRAVELKPSSFRDTQAGSRIPIQVSIQTYKETVTEDPETTMIDSPVKGGSNQSISYSRAQADLKV